MPDKWYKDLRRNIIGIPLSKDAPRWQSSTPTPLRQLQNLGTRGPFVNEYKDYVKDEEFAKLVKGKRVAYVCPSPHLRGMKMGAHIDSYDLVVRVNQAYDMPEEDWEDYGKRTDILMNCLNVNKIGALRQNMDYARSLKYIVCPMVSMWDIQRVDDFLNEIGTPWHNVNDGYLFKVFNEVGTTCNTGLMGIIDILNYDVEEIYVTGMTFFNMNNFGEVYYNNYHNEAIKNGNFKESSHKIPNFSDLRIDIHQQVPQIEYFHKMIYFHYGTKLTLDEYLEENFKNTINKAKNK
tara:strand:+ start:2445 stop:3320 length:876 start_codon:yes stop_codon:yes gene_type:complete